MHNMPGPAICWPQAVLLGLQQALASGDWEGQVPPIQPPVLMYHQQQEGLGRRLQNRQVCCKHLWLYQQ
jgi:hypothetical protein